MRRSHRTVHRLVWPILALLVGFGVAMALALRPPPMPDEVAEPDGAAPVAPGTPGTPETRP